MNHPPCVSDLDLLARHSTAIFGKALSPEHLGSIIGTAPPVSGRPDFVDKASNEIWRGLRALAVLQQLAAASEAGKATARVLLYAHLVCSPTVRVGVGARATLAVLAGSTPLPPEPLPPAAPHRRASPSHKRLYLKEKESYGSRLRAWQDQARRLAERGDAVLRAAVVAFRARAEGL